MDKTLLSTTETSAPKSIRVNTRMLRFLVLMRLLISVSPACRQIIKTKVFVKVETFKLCNDGMDDFCECFYMRIGVVFQSSYKSIQCKFILLQESHKHMKENGGVIVWKRLQFVSIQ